MASSYPQPGPGPSNYYSQQSPPPPPAPGMMYGANSAGPSSFPYQYGAPAMHSGHPMPPQMNGRARGSYSQRVARGITHTHPAYHPPPHQPFSPVSPHSMSPHPSAYPPQNFAPAYSYPQHPPYPPPSWQAQPPLSPLPKQLSMPPPSVNPVPSTEPDTVLTTTDSHPADPVPSVETLKDAVPSPPSSPTPSASESRVSRPTSPSSQSTTSTSEPQRHFGPAEWVIWSRRPDDPASAPGIIFSPRSKPPPHIVRDALQIPQPPEVEPPPLEQEHEQESSSSSTVPSSDAAYTPTVPGSPISSNTSVSAPDSPPEEAKQEPLIEEATSLTPVPSIEPVSAPVVDTPVVPPPVKKSWASLLRSTDDAPSKNALPTSTVIGFSIPATPIAPVTSPKKTALHTLLTTGSGAPVPHVIPRGLINTGNMCFANSVLQILLHCPPFLKLFHELGKLGYNETEVPLTHATIEFLNEFVASKRQPEEERDSFIPAGIYDAMKEKKRFDNMRGGHQEDAEEFLGFYLDTLEEELLAMIAPEQPIPVVEEHEEDAPPVDDGWLEVGKKNRTVVTRTVKSTNSPITKIFGGKARSTLRAPSQKDSVIVEDWRALRLDIQPEHIHSIEDAVKHIADPQTIQRGDGMGDASQQMLVEALPAILILHVKRFHFDTTVGDVVKVGKQIVFGPELEIPLDIMAPTSRRPTKYKLFGAVYHHGVSASGGHYTLDVLHRENWIRIDDELVSDVRREDVFDAFERDESRTAYLLFYRRVR